MIGFTHMLNNEVADSSTDPRGAEWGGLSPFGRAVVAERNRLGILVDASHASDAALEQMMEVSRTPVILSHTGCRAVCDHPRNIGDELLRRLAGAGRCDPDERVARRDGQTARERGAGRGGGCDHGTVSRRGADGGSAGRGEQRPGPSSKRATRTRRRRWTITCGTCVHAVRVAGADHVGIGCDLDGGGGFDGLRDVAAYPAITQALLAAGLSEAELAKIWGENTLRVFRAAEAARGA